MPTYNTSTGIAISGGYYVDTVGKNAKKIDLFSKVIYAYGK